jgi:AcrR family transcriptional regulator
MPRPGRPAQIDRGQLVQAALELIDAVGIDGCTMRAVADKVSVTPMALYRHVANKDELMSLIPDTLLSDVAANVLTQSKAMAALKAIAVGLDAVLVAHPHVATLFLQPVPGPNMVAASTHVIDLFARRNVEGDHAFAFIRATVAMAIGQVLTSHGGDHYHGIELLLRGIESSLRQRPSVPG